MMTEVTAACAFLSKQLAKSFPPEQVHAFQQALSQALQRKYAAHWIVDRPFQGNAFRSLSICDGVAQKIIRDAAAKVGIRNIGVYFPNDITIWVDPYCVSYRIGSESNPVITIWENFTKPETLELPVFARTARSPQPLSTSSPSISHLSVSSPTPLSLNALPYSPRSPSNPPLHQQNIPILSTSTTRYTRHTQPRSLYVPYSNNQQSNAITQKMPQGVSYQQSIVMAN